MSGVRDARSPRRARWVAGVVAAAMGTVAGAAMGGAGCLVFDDTVVPAIATPVTLWVAPEVAYLSLDDAVRACRWVMECPRLAASLTRSIALPVDDHSYSLCLHWMAGALPEGRVGLEAQRALVQQVADAQDCETAVAAMWVEDIDPTTDPRCAGPGKFSCEDDVAIDCDNGSVSHCDSPRYVDGTTCMGAPFFRTCASGTCAQGDAGVEDSCSGGVGTLCVQDLSIDVACAPLGITCEDETTFCSAGGYSFECQGPGGPRCGDANRSVDVCVYALIGSTFDCTTIAGGQCAIDGPPRCIHGAPACTIPDADAGASATGPAADVDTCSAGKLRACVDGQAIEVSCGDQGLACVPATGSVSGHCGTAKP